MNDETPTLAIPRRRESRQPFPPPTAEAIVPFAADDPTVQANFSFPRAAETLQLDFGSITSDIQRILVLKLDHFGDFIIGLPALRDLRSAFPRAYIRMVCGDWNFRNAQDSGLFDDIRGFNYFPESAGGWNGEPIEDMAAFEHAIRGSFDLAVDLRVDEDTRHLLARIDTRVRCGIGSRSRFPLLDIALPGERNRPNSILENGSSIFLPAAHFRSTLSGGSAMHHEGPLVAQEGRPLINGLLPPLPAGRFQATIGLTVHKFLPGLKGCSILVEIAEGEKIIRDRVLGRVSLSRLGRKPMILEFDNEMTGARLELRVRGAGKPISGNLRFWGVQITRGTAFTPPPRFRPVELHVGETLSLLIALIRQRTAQLYQRPSIPLAHSTEGAHQIVIAPFSNSTTRNWPAAYYARLVALLLERTDREITLVGTAAQLTASHPITEHNASSRLHNLIGRTNWAELTALLRNCDLVICNNSGIAHLGASIGARVLAIYSGSHQPQEWGPRGPLSHVIMHSVPCSPCGLERLEECDHDHACMRLITPEQILERGIELLATDKNQESLRDGP